MISFNSLSLSLRIDNEYDLFCLGIVPTWFMIEIIIPLFGNDLLADWILLYTTNLWGANFY